MAFSIRTLPCELIGGSIALVAPASARDRSQIDKPCGGASSSFAGAAVSNKLFPRCASRGSVKSACRGAANELLGGVVTDNKCVLCTTAPAPLAFHRCGPVNCL